MPTTHKQAQAMLDADLRLTSMGVLCPQVRSSQDAELADRQTLACRIATLTGLPTSWESRKDLRHDLTMILRAIRAGTFVPMETEESSSTKIWRKRLGIEYSHTKQATQSMTLRSTHPAFLPRA